MGWCIGGFRALAFAAFVPALLLEGVATVPKVSATGIPLAGRALDDSFTHRNRARAFLGNSENRTDVEMSIPTQPVGPVAISSKPGSFWQRFRAGKAEDGNHPMFDWFFVIYWSIAATATAIISRDLVRVRSIRVLPEEGEPIEELDSNMWALNLVAAVGEAKFADGTRLSAVWVAVMSGFMAAAQICVVILMALAIDPNARPWTNSPGSPWLQHKSGFQVNCMKLIMVTFLTVGQIGETYQCRRCATASLRVHEDRLLVPRWVPLGAAVLQYMVSLLVVWAGVAIILSFQTAPDIIYSSMSVFFITSADEMLFDCLSSVFDVKAEFDCFEGFKQSRLSEGVGTPPRSPRHEHDHPRRAATGFAAWGSHSRKPSCIISSPRISSKTEPSGLEAVDEEIEKYDHKELSSSVWLTMKVLQVFPLFFGFFLMGRAWHTGIMPTNRVHLIGL